MKKLLVILFAVLLSACVEPTYSFYGVDTYCNGEFCPPPEKMKVALASQKGMWAAAGYPWPEDVNIHVSDRDWMHARGSSAHGSIYLWKRGHPYWEAVVDHEMGMIILEVAHGKESATINLRKKLGVCYANGDTGYCK